MLLIQVNNIQNSKETGENEKKKYVPEAQYETIGKTPRQVCKPTNTENGHQDQYQHSLSVRCTVTYSQEPVVLRTDPPLMYSIQI